MRYFLHTASDIFYAFKLLKGERVEEEKVEEVEEEEEHIEEEEEEEHVEEEEEDQMVKVMIYKNKTWDTSSYRFLCRNFFGALVNEYSLRLYKTSVRDSCWKDFISLFETSTTMKTLEIEKHDFFVSSSPTQTRFLDFSKALCKNTSLTELSINDMVFPNNELSNIADILTHNSTITSLSLQNNLISSSTPGFNNFISALKCNKSLTSLDLSRNLLSCDGIFKLNKVLKSNTSIVSLNLSHNGIKENALKSLAGVLKRNTTLTHLDLSKNISPYASSMRVSVSTAFSEMLEVNMSLTSLIF